MGQQVSTEAATKFRHNTPIGDFQGLTIRDPVTESPQCYRFTNIRYGAPPMNESRWKKPKAVPQDYSYSDHSYCDLGKPCYQPRILEPKLAPLYNLGESGEDCTYLNIWIPANLDLKDSNVEKLPVFFYIHGGWLQYGSPNLDSSMDPRYLHELEESGHKYIVVAPAYRLNVFGFLSCEYLEKLGSGANFGLWDQRLALEWTYNNIKYFGGDPDRITVGGLSAGSYSTFLQLAYEVYHPEETQIIKQVVHFSNCILFQPKSISETNVQFEELCDTLGVDTNLDAAGKLEALKGIDPKSLADVLPEMSLHTFRAVTDDDFVSASLIKDIQSGLYAKTLAAKKVRIIIGEVSNEPVMYSYLNTPIDLEALSLQLENYYPKAVVPTLLSLYLNPDELPDTKNSLRELFGEIVASSQVYASSRGFLHYLTSQGFFPESSIYRFKCSFSPELMKERLSKMGVKGPIHGGDQPLWFFATSAGIKDHEKEKIIKFIGPLSEFIHCKDIRETWGTSGIKLYRHLQEDGSTVIEEDSDWLRDVANAKKLIEVQI
ncbi:Piso0_002342 [Millerozyma farinosa CBS 7064]|uniref:Carboxylic ester hydrolase n=1 Tax=Pichia sorbitophila (strain ATCC MYA-4447 / BCRC 22081 / CBS 7064 / NBRC 10061 / NRRL Y-12695) TaxID=559304 RepID=G8YCC9_PICSO|nr:Piso0_002342 [Millerozyma farinosa CBS 7064]